MSIEQQPPKQSPQTPDRVMPPWPKSKEDTIVPPKEHRDAPRFSKKEKIGAGLAAAVLAVGSGLFGKALAGGDSESDLYQPHSNENRARALEEERNDDAGDSPIAPGETEAPEETIPGGVTLSAEQAEIMASGDLEAMNEVIDDTLQPPIYEALTDYVQGKTDSVDASGYSTNPDVTSAYLTSFADDVLYGTGETKNDSLALWFCYSDKDPQSVGACLDNATDWLGSGRYGDEKPTLRWQLSSIKDDVFLPTDPYYGAVAANIDVSVNGDKVAIDFSEPE